MLAVEQARRAGKQEAATSKYLRQGRGRRWHILMAYVACRRQGGQVGTSFEWATACADVRYGVVPVVGQVLRAGERACAREVYFTNLLWVWKSRGGGEVK